MVIGQWDAFIVGVADRDVAGGTVDSGDVEHLGQERHFRPEGRAFDCPAIGAKGGDAGRKARRQRMIQCDASWRTAARVVAPGWKVMSTSISAGVADRTTVSSSAVARTRLSPGRSFPIREKRHSPGTAIRPPACSPVTSVKARPRASGRHWRQVRLNGPRLQQAPDVRPSVHRDQDPGDRNRRIGQSV